MTATTVETAEFRRSSGFSRWLRRKLRASIIPRSDPENRTAYLGQFDQASRNVEIAAEGLGRLFKNHPVKSLWVVRAIGDWLVRYFDAQKRAANRPRYYVYTQFDSQIPFRPEEDILYTYMIAQIAYIANELADIVSVRQMIHIADGFIELNKAGVEAFRRYPTLMPRFLNHKRLSLKVIQQLDRPLNCCPSLHIAYSLFLDGIAELMIKPHPNRRDAFDSVRFSTIGMFNSVLYTKQHSILDVAFGMLCAKIVFEDRFDRPFNDFIGVFPSLKRRHPIPYDEIARVYRKALAIQRRGHGLADILGTYLRSHGYLKIAPDEGVGTGYFDTSTRQLVRTSEDKGVTTIGSRQSVVG